jgi:pyruvate/2-oxoglutarate dehydrogenase complex dihydrolipoamide dehydrogenase (E3) component
VKDMDAYRKAALLDDGRIIFFEKCLLATGGEPRQLPGAPKHSHITTFRSVRQHTSYAYCYLSLMIRVAGA